MTSFVKNAKLERKICGKNMIFPKWRKEERRAREEARAMIVSGFADNVSKELPLEYAMEMNNLSRLEMKGSIG